MDLIQEISNKASNLSEKDLDEWIVPQLTAHYSSKIRSLASLAYGRGSVTSENSLALQAFRERAKAEIRNGMNTFLFISQHWRLNRDINSYVLTCLNRLANRIKSDADSIKKISLPICPICKIYGDKEYVRYEGKFLRCNSCFSKIEDIESRINKESDTHILASLTSELRLRTIFSTHSKSGFRCPLCEKFVPESYIKNYGVSCPYDDCSWFGTKNELEFMMHPLSLSSQSNLSLNVPIGTWPGFSGTNGTSEWLDMIKSQDIDPEEYILINQEYEKELGILLEVIEDQINSVKRNEKSVQKLLMYQAYKNIIDLYPEDMVSYLVHMKHSNVESPIQSRIFQEYVRLLENKIPFILHKNGKEVEVCSLLDVNLGLFLGHSEFEATVRKDHIITNNTIETYTGGRKLKFFGPCFMGMLIDVKDRHSGESLKSKVKHYTFVQIKMQDDVPSGLPVTVSHFRIPSHYEMMHLVVLQRVRRRIVDSVYIRTHGEKREINK